MDGHLPAALSPLVALPHWVIWRWDDVKGKKSKVPYQSAHPRKKAKNNDPSTWSDFATAVAATKMADGIGFCLLDSGFGAFDLDHCRDPDTGIIDSWASELVHRAGSYTEVTISGTGLRIIGRATSPKIHRQQSVKNGAKGAKLETYRKAERYIVMTGDVLPGSTPVLAELDAVMDAVVAELDGGKANDASRDGGTAAGFDIDGLPISDRMKNLIRGIDDPEHPYTSRSERVMAVLVAMAGAGCTNEQIEALFLNPNRPISAHILDQAKPSECLTRQIAKARKAARDPQRCKDERALRAGAHW